MFTCERGERVGLAGGGRDASVGEPVVGRKGLEELDGGLEERDGLSALRAARRQAGRFEGAVASTMGAPLVLEHIKQAQNSVCCSTVVFTRKDRAPTYFPELFVLTIDVDPEL